MTNRRREHRVLAIDPTTRGFAFAVMEGPHDLVDWGVKSVRPAKQAQCLAGVAGQIAFFAPTVIVLEDTAKRGSRRCRRVRRLIEAIRALAERAGVPTRLVSRRQVKNTFVVTGANTKHQIAVAIAEQLPELADRLPPYRESWMSEDYRMNIFDAVAFAVTFFALREKRRHARWSNSIPHDAPQNPAHSRD
jgi:Holliday junction resolvasome RuvABC endonuclease subunit